MKIIHTADWHLGKNLEGYSRLEEQAQFLQDFISMVESHQADMVMIAGDVYDQANPPAQAEKLFYDTLKQLSHQGQRLILVIAGNHDSPERLVAAGPLAQEHGIIMVGTPKTVIPVGQYGQHQVIRSGEGFVEVEIGQEKAVILTVPYPSEKRLNEVLYDEMTTQEQRLQSYNDRVVQLFATLEQQFGEDTINLVVAHLFAMGSEKGQSERSIELGGAFILDGSCFPKQAQYIALGHIHKPQIVPGSEKRARYSGSPLHYNRKEISFAKQCLLVEVVAQQEAKVTAVPIPVYKPIEVWQCDSIDDAIQRCEAQQHCHCWVYLEVTTDRYIREDEIKQMRQWKKDILGIMPILVQTEQQVSTVAPMEQTFEQIFQQFYQNELGVAADEEIMQLLFSIIGQEDDDETNMVENKWCE